MRELSLFSGAGGGLLASKLLRWRTIGYVEYEAYCQKVIKQRIVDGVLDAAPIFGDIRNFVSEGYADAYRGVVDVVSGGFPCQPFSVAGRRAAESDPRNMWPATIEVIRRVHPKFAFLENVRGLLSKDYFGQILKELAESGYDARWCVLGADDVGAPHQRKRLWILAHAKTTECEWGGTPRTWRNGPTNSCCRWWSADPADIPHPTSKQSGGVQQQSIWAHAGAGVYQTRETDVRSTQPIVGRVADGVAYRVDRLRAIGNGQVPLVAATAFRLLSDGLF